MQIGVHGPPIPHEIRTWSPADKVFFTKDGVDDLTFKIHAEKKADFAAIKLNAGVFVQNRPIEVVPIVKHMTSEFTFVCDHRNSFLKPNLFKDSNDLTAYLTGDTSREFTTSFGDDPVAAQSGRYDCSWTSVQAPEIPSPTSSFDINIYADNILCYIDGNSGQNVTKYVENGTAPNKNTGGCSLKWAGSKDGVNLKWLGDVGGVVSNGMVLKTTSLKVDSRIRQIAIGTFHVRH
jgi:hypothetical protein